MLFLTYSISYSATDPIENASLKKDTLSALVSYGDSWLTRQAFDMDKLNISLLLDSLYGLDDIPFETINNLYFVNKIQKKSVLEIDSFFGKTPLIVSKAPPLPNAITGTPQAMASRPTNPKLSASL